MDAHLFRLFCRFLCPKLQDARIEKIQEPFSGHLTLSLYNASRKFNLVCRFGRREPFAFLTNRRPEALPKPSAPIMRLRKYCGDKQIRLAFCDVWQRRIWLLTGTTAEGKMIWLCLDLVQGPLLHFLDEPPHVEEHHWPPVGELDGILENWQAWPMLTPALRRTLSQLIALEQKALLADLEDGCADIYSYADADGIRKISAWPLPPGLCEGLQEKVSEDILATFEKAGQDLVLRGIYLEKRREADNLETRRQKKLARTLANLEQDRARLTAMAALEPDAIALAANLYRWDKNEKRASVTIGNEEDARELTLNNRITIGQNLERMFHTIKRGKRGLKMLEGRARELQAGMAVEEPPTPPGERRVGKVETVSKRIETFRSSDGFLLLRGRDARANLSLRKSASAHDLWVHIETGPGAHVIIRRHHAAHEVPERTLLEAGRLAAEKSWAKDAPTAAIMYAELRHVKPVRGGPPGKVTVDRLFATRLVPLAAPMPGEDQGILP